MGNAGPGLGSIEPVERIHAPSRQQFVEEYVRPGRPVVLTGVVDQWPAAERWTVDYLKDVAGEAVVPVRYSETSEDINQSFLDKREMTLADYLDRLTGTPPETRFYLTDQPLLRISRDLLADLDNSTFADESETDVYNNFFVGPDTVTPLHFHGRHDTVLCMLVGRKRLTLYPPGEHHCLYPYTWRGRWFYVSQVDEWQPDLDRFPKFAQAQRTEVVLEPGEALFIPVHWWHGVITDGLSIATTCGWSAGRSAFGLRNPGRYVLAHHLWVSLRSRLRPKKRVANA